MGARCGVRLLSAEARRAALSQVSYDRYDIAGSGLSSVDRAAQGDTFRCAACIECHVFCRVRGSMVRSAITEQVQHSSAIFAASAGKQG